MTDSSNSVGGVVLPGTLIRRLSLPNTSYITNTFDNVARLTGTWLNDSGNGTLDSALYGYNQGNQRTTFTNAAGTYYEFAYDNIGQLKVADRIEPHTPTIAEAMPRFWALGQLLGYEGSRTREQSSPTSN